MATCLTDKIVKTRKPHRCGGCRKIFPAGRMLRYISAVGDDGFWNGYMCKACEKQLHREGYDYYDGYSEGELREDRIQEAQWYFRDREG